MGHAIVRGNAYEDRNDRHWLIGHFIDESKGLRRDSRVEIMWSSRKAGEEKNGWTKSSKATTVCILIRGRMSNIFPETGEVFMEKEGDYIVYPPNTLHTWKAYKDSIILTIRWPSEPGHIIEESGPFK